MSPQSASAAAPTAASLPFAHRALRPGPLAPWVEEIWYSQGRLESLRERVLPSATADLVVNLGPALRLAEGQGDERILGATVGGLLLRPILLHHPPVHEVVGLRLSPLGIRALLGVPAREVLDATRQVGEVLPRSRRRAGEELAERCTEASSPEAVLRVAADWAADGVRRHADGVDPLVHWAVERLAAAGGRGSVGALQRASGYGARRFTDRFRDELGIPPKTFARLVRFRRAVAGLEPGRDLAGFALDLGLSDQSHLNRELRAFAGLSPTEILESDRYPSGFTMAVP